MLVEFDSWVVEILEDVETVLMAQGLKESAKQLSATRQMVMDEGLEQQRTSNLGERMHPGYDNVISLFG